MGFLGYANEEGEIAVAKGKAFDSADHDCNSVACARANALMCLSTYANKSIEDIRAAIGYESYIWQQLAVYKNREKIIVEFYIE